MTDAATAFENSRKKHFLLNEEVIIYNLGDGKEYTGRIRGIAYEHVIDHYIIELTTPDMFPEHCDKNGEPWDCVVLTEACIKRR